MKLAIQKFSFFLENENLILQNYNALHDNCYINNTHVHMTINTVQNGWDDNNAEFD